MRQISVGRSEICRRQSNGCFDGYDADVGQQQDSQISYATVEVN